MMKERIIRFLVVITILAMVATPVTAQTEQPPIDRSNLQPRDPAEAARVELIPGVDLSNAIRSADGKVGLIVRLLDEPLATYQGGVENIEATMPEIAGTMKLDVGGDNSQAYIDYLEKKQSTFIAELAKTAPSADVERTFTVALNAVSIKIAENEIKALLGMPDVLQVYPDQIREASMDASLDLINAPGLWAELGGRESAGQGFKVAVVDTGLRFNNPMFGNPGDAFEMPFGYPRGYCQDNPADPQVFCNGKVIVARYYLDPDLKINTAEVSSPLDINGHGSHTAGTAAGNKVTVAAGDVIPQATEISGVAPGAYLMIYKALFENAAGTNGTGTDSMLSAAMEAALKDGADVINNSWGGGAGEDPLDSLYTPLIDAITAAGTLVVFAAGNEGPSGTTIGCPGCVESALTVAASSTERLIANKVTITAPAPVPVALTNIPGIQGDGPAIVGSLTGPFKHDATNADGCAVYPAGTFSGSIALIKRGTCNFSTKVLNAANAGATGVIMINNTGGPPISMSSVNGVSIPSLMVSETDGKAILDFLALNPAATIGMVDANLFVYHIPAWADIMASFSSVGPNGDPNVLKPDISAPGVNILSAYSGAMESKPDPYYAIIGGTSMAAPHVSGAAALIMQLNPALSPVDVKTLLTSTSNPDVLKPNGKTAADAFNMGAGRLDLETAMAGGLAFNKPSFANPACVLNCGWTNTIKNIGTTTTTWKASVTGDEGLKLVVLPDTITLAPGMQTTFEVQADVADGFPGEWVFGNVTWTETSGSYPAAHLPVAVMPQISTDDKSFFKHSTAIAEPGEILDYTITIRNLNPVETTFFLRDKMPTNLTYVDGSLNSNVNAIYSPADDWIEAEFALQPPMTILISDNAGGFFDLTDEKMIDLDGICAPNCDDYDITLIGANLDYYGRHYDRITVSSNGYLVPGGYDGPSNPVPQEFPNPALPNNVIAPLWTDLDFDAQSDWFYTGSVGWDVFQWTNMLQKGTNVRYSFQVWIGMGPEPIIIISYDVPLPAELPDYPTVIGIENADGTDGTVNFYSDGTTARGFLPDTEVPDIILITIVDMTSISYKGLVDVTDMSVPVIFNVAELADSESNLINRAVARTDIIFQKLWLPLLMK